MDAAIETSLKKYKQLSGNDKVAKGLEMAKGLLDDVSDKDPSLSKAAKSGLISRFIALHDAP